MKILLLETCLFHVTEYLLKTPSVPHEASENQLNQGQQPLQCVVMYA